MAKIKQRVLLDTYAFGEGTFAWEVTPLEDRLVCHLSDGMQLNLGKLTMPYLSMQCQHPYLHWANLIVSRVPQLEERLKLSLQLLSEGKRLVVKDVLAPTGGTLSTKARMECTQAYHLPEPIQLKPNPTTVVFLWMNEKPEAKLSDFFSLNEILQILNVLQVEGAQFSRKTKGVDPRWVLSLYQLDVRHWEKLFDRSLMSLLKEIFGCEELHQGRMSTIERQIIQSLLFGMPMEGYFQFL